MAPASAARRSRGTLAAQALQSTRRMKAREALDLLKETGNSWLDDKAMRLAASLAFYTLLSLAPLLVLVVSLAGLVFGDEAARGGVAGQISGLVGEQSADAIQTILANAKKPSSGVLGTVFGVSLLLFGASGVFGELQEAMNVIWEVQPKPGRGVLGLVRDRFFSFTMVLGVAFLLLVSLVFGAALAAMGRFFAAALPGGETLWQAVNAGVSFAVVTGLFATIFKVVPDVKVAWRDVLGGAALTALLFTAGKLLIGLYLGKSGVASPFGAAGSIVVIVIWVYYSAQILFFGAELTRAYARHRGAKVVPTENAEPLTDDAKAQMGIPAGARVSEA